MIRSYQDLRVWQMSMDFAVAVYRAFPNPSRAGMRGFIDQVRRSATSVPAYIAEGYGRESTRSYTQYLKIARGSLNETETHILLAARLELVEPESASDLLQSSKTISKMLSGLIASVNNASHRKMARPRHPAPIA
jgi:four helix bundle protein